MGTVEQVLERAARCGLDVVAITDHEDAAGGLQARELAAKRNLGPGVIPGAEVTTLQGHLLALFVERCPKSFRSIERTLEDIHAQGGLAIVPHPMSWLTRSVSLRTLERIQARAEAGVTFDGIETANPSPAGRVTGASARRLNRRWQLPETGGSDAHHVQHIGAGWTEFHGSRVSDLRTAMRNGEVTAHCGRYPGLFEIGLGQTLAGLAWGYAATPRKMLRLRQPMGRHR